MPKNAIAQVAAIVDTAGVIDAMQGDRFKAFLDQIPVAVAVSEIEGKGWRKLPSIASLDGDDYLLRDAVLEDSDLIGVFTIERKAGVINVDVWSNTIEDETGKPIHRIVAMGAARDSTDDRNTTAATLASKDTLLKELQHRVKNNLQMVNALIRLEARKFADDDTSEGFSRLAGRVNALAVLYDALSLDKTDDHVDLGAYLGQIAAAVMQAHAVEGVRLDATFDTWPVSVNVALPAGLVVNEVLTNASKHAFAGRAGGTVKLHSQIDDQGCHITIADDGVGLPQGQT
jgi:two-component sensor histidine kinase